MDGPSTTSYVDLKIIAICTNWMLCDERNRCIHARPHAPSGSCKLGGCSQCMMTCEVLNERRTRKEVG